MLDGETDGSYSFSDEEEQESSDTSDVETDDQSREFNYTLKLINLMCKTDFQTIELGKGKKLKSLSSLQQFISKKLSTNPKFQTPDLKTVQMGYLETGHGLKGRKFWIHVDSDVKMTYEKFEKKKSIILWCYTKADTQATKKKPDTSGSKPSRSGTKYGQHLEDRTAVDDIQGATGEAYKLFS